MEQSIPLLRHRSNPRRISSQPVPSFNRRIRNQKQRHSIGVAFILVVVFGAGCTADRPTLQAPQPSTPGASQSDALAIESETTTSTISTPPPTTQPEAPSGSEGPTGDGDREPVSPTLVVVAPGAEPRFQVDVLFLEDQSINLVLSDVRDITLSQDSTTASALSFGSDTPLVASSSTDPGTTRLHIGIPVIRETSGPAAMLESAKETASSLNQLWFDQPAPNQGIAQTGDKAPVDDLGVAETFAGFIEAFRLSQISVPTQELGVGAIWSTEAQTLFGGLPANVIKRATVISVDEGSVRAQVTIQVVFEQGTVELPSGSATIIDGATTFTGEVVWSANSPVALFDLAGSSDLRMAITDAAGSTVVHQAVVQTYSLRLG